MVLLVKNLFLITGGLLNVLKPKPPVYTYRVRRVGGVDVLCIIDMYSDDNPSLTVTNGVDFVLGEISNKEKNIPDIVIYRDTDGYWDRIKIKNGSEFSKFTPIVPGCKDRPTSEDVAVQLAVTLLGESGHVHQ